ncbi:MAG: galactokinase [Planctomycetota bacterium]
MTTTLSQFGAPHSIAQPLDVLNRYAGAEGPTGRSPAGLDLAAQAASAFADRFGEPPRVMAVAPGRVNLIGEHTDYNDGFVLPMAINRFTAVALSPRPEHEAEVVFTSIEGRPLRSFRLARPFVSTGHPPSDYASAVWGRVAEMLEGTGGPALPGFRAAVVSDVPIGGGLSSSAALEVSTAAAMLAAMGVDDTDPVEIAMLCQRAEHDVGVPCGIMDQLASACGIEHRALRIDCRDRSVTPADLGDRVEIVVSDSKVRHSLADGEYAKRKASCAEAVEAHNRLLRDENQRIAALRDVAVAEIDRIAGRADEVVLRRSRHVVTENQRVIEACDALADRNYQRAGVLMVKSHVSLRDDYEVSCAELDALVRDALDVEGVYGSRMTGGGFGGCTVSLIERGRGDRLITHLRERAARDGRPEPACFVVQPSDGVWSVRYA